MTEVSLGPRSKAFRFDELPEYYTCVFSIEGRSRVFVLDTFAGSRSGEQVRARIAALYPQKPIVVVNSHFHWDHVWGNLAFSDCLIVSHRLCREGMISRWDEQIQSRGQYLQGTTAPVFPGAVFDQSLDFPDDEVSLFHTPGHTADSLSVYDRREQALYVFDNVEKPLVYVEDPDVDRYLRTLESYLSLQPHKIYASHTLELDGDDVRATMGYLRALQAGKETPFSSEYERRVHGENRAVLRSAPR